MNKTEYLEYCNQKYTEGNPVLPDEVYDRLVENTALENRVGYIEVGEQRFQHPFPMYSLQKVFVGEDEEPKWDINQTQIMTAKLDGAAVSITYVDGVLTQALSRGDGKEGLDITEAFKNTFANTGAAVIFTSLTLAIGVSTWSFSALKFQADMGMLLTFMFIVNMLCAMTTLPALAVVLDKLFPRKN